MTSLKFEECFRDCFRLSTRKTCPLSVQSKIYRDTTLLKIETVMGLLLGIYELTRIKSNSKQLLMYQ